LLLLVACGVLTWWVFRSKQAPTPEGDDLALIPANAQAFLGIHLAELWKTPAMREALRERRERDPEAEDPAETLDRQTGLRPEQVERLTVVTIDSGRRLGWAVARTLAAYDRARVLHRLGSSRQVFHQGQSYHLGMGADGRPAAVSFVGTRVLVAGPEEGVRLCLELAGKASKRPLESVISLLASGQHTAVAGVNPQASGETMKLQAGLPTLENIRLITATLDVNEKVVLEAKAELVSEETAERLSEVLKGYLAKAKLLGLVALVDPEGPVAKSLALLRKMKVTQQGNQVKLKADVEKGSSVAGLLLTLPGPWKR
jgi:hypothetical protein